MVVWCCYGGFTGMTVRCCYGARDVVMAGKVLLWRVHRNDREVHPAMFQQLCSRSHPAMFQQLCSRSHPAMFQQLCSRSHPAMFQQLCSG